MTDGSYDADDGLAGWKVHRSYILIRANEGLQIKEVKSE